MRYKPFVQGTIFGVQLSAFVIGLVWSLWTHDFQNAWPILISAGLMWAQVLIVAGI